MQLILMRHGEAEPDFRNDPGRNLTTRGFMECQKTGLWLNENFSEIDYALVSPYIRARQSWEMVKAIVPIGHTEESADIVPSGQPNLVHDYVHVLCQERKLDTLLIVSHMPLVSYLLDSFCAELRSHLFSTASVAVMNYDIEHNQATLDDIFTPAL